jgi:hypothetical protein
LRVVDAGRAVARFGDFLPGPGSGAFSTLQTYQDARAPLSLHHKCATSGVKPLSSQLPPASLERAQRCVLTKSPRLTAGKHLPAPATRTPGHETT